LFLKKLCIEPDTEMKYNYGHTGVALVLTLLSVSSSNAEGKKTAKEVVAEVLRRQPLIDAHNDVAMNLREHFSNDLTNVKFDEDLRKQPIWKDLNTSHTDLPRLRSAKFGAVFFSAFVECRTQYRDAVEQTLEQIDVVKRLIKKYDKDLSFSTCVKDAQEAMSKGKIATFIGVEGGHSIQSNLGILRILYELGARYLTLTHNCNNPWADSNWVETKEAKDLLPVEHNGLSNFGLEIVDEMNRLGMMVDLSHTSVLTMKAALARTKAPVIFSHSGAKKIADHQRNVPDDVLELVKKTNSVVMMNFFSGFVRTDGQRATIKDVVDHIEHIRSVAGPDHLGFGGDFDGVDLMPVGLEDVSKYPDLLEALYNTGHWTASDLEKISGGNILRVLGDVEKVSKELQGKEAFQTPLKTEGAKTGGVNITGLITDKFF